jgi:hypothetical protein
MSAGVLPHGVELLVAEVPNRVRMIDPNVARDQHDRELAVGPDLQFPQSLQCPSAALSPVRDEVRHDRVSQN